MESDHYNYGTERNEGLNYYQQEITENALKIRLETNDVKERIEMFLSGESYEVTDDGKLIKKTTGEPKANPKGIREIMNVLNSYINSSTVQGNLTQEQMNMVMVDYHRGMGNLLGFHADEWGIDRNERKAIVQFIEPFVFLFVSRTRDNKERESYNMAVRESGTSHFSRERGGNPLAFWKR